MDVRDVAAAYRLEEVLSASPLSTVRRAIDPGSGQIVAVKILKPLTGGVSQGQRERFITAMRRLAELQLAAMPEVLDYGFTADDGAFLVTSFVEGTPLSDFTTAPVERIVPILADLARALEVLADNGLVHHNLCPENVLVVESPGAETVQLLGLGTVAYLAADGGEAPLGRSPEAERFAAAELLVPRALAHSLAWRADLYSFALLACELLHAEVVGLGSPAPRVSLPISELRHGAALQEHLSVALRRDPQARTTTFAELRRLLLSRLAPAIPPSPSPGASEKEEGGEVEATIRQPLPTASAVRPGPGRPQLKVKVGMREAAEPARREPAPTAAANPEPLPESPPRPPFDPNKTDPALVVPVVPAPPGEPVAAQEPAEVEELEAQAELPPPPAPTPPEPSSPPLAAPPPPPPPVQTEPSPAARAGGAPESRPSPPPPTAAPAAPPRSRSRWKIPLLAGAALLLLLGAGIVAVILFDPGPVPLIVVPTPVPATPVPPPVAPAAPDRDPQLLAARDAMEDGDFEAARRILGEISPERLAALSPADAALARSIAAELEGMSRERAIADLAQGLRSGNMRTLRAAVDALAGMTAREQAAVPGLREQLAKANEALKVSGQMTRAQRAGDHLELLQRSAEMTAILPANQRAFELREEAARALLAEADGHLQARRWDRAIQRLELVANAWPEAPGVAERLARARHERAIDEQARRLLADAAQALERGNPEAGLALLGSLAPPPYLASAFAETRDRLQARLAELDAQAPVIAISPGFDPRFKKDETLAVPVRITDDYRVASAKAFVRTDERKQYREVQLKHLGGDEYVLELSPAVHGNAGAVELYIVATDTSGHSSSLGTANKPYEVKRRRLFGR